MKVIRIPYNMNEECTVHDIPDRIDDSIEASGRVLDDIKELIGIEWAEIVVTWCKNYKDRTRDYCLIVDEIGKCKDGWTDRINLRGSRFYAGTVHGDPIVGDVVLCAREWTDSFGECDLAGLTDYEIDVFISHLRSGGKCES